MGDVRHIHGDWDDHFVNETVEEQLELTSFEETLPLFVKHLTKNERIIDLGCGLGKHLIYWHNRNYDIIGIDSERRCIDRIGRFSRSVDARVGDVLSLPFDDGSFGFAISYGVLEHFANGPSDALREMGRVLRTGGKAFISVPLDNGLAQTTRRARGSKVLSAVMRKQSLAELRRRECKTAGGIVELSFSKTDFERVLAENGFRIIDSLPILTKWGLCNALPFLKIKAFPKEPTYAIVLNPPLNMLGILVHGVAKRICPWWVAHFQFYVVEKDGLPLGGGKAC